MAKQTVEVFGGIQLTIPDNFRELTEDEKKVFFASTNSRQWAVWNKEKHTMISSEYKNVVPWDSLNRSAANTRKFMRKKFNKYKYKEIDFTKRMNGEFPLYVIQYTYNIQETAEHAWTVCVLRKNKLGTISFVTREDFVEETREEIEECVRSIH